MNTKAGEGTRAGTVAVGIDVGGTFTDLAAVHDDGAVSTSKVLSVPGDRAQGVLDALQAAGVAASAVSSIAHGTTVVTNLLLERRGARVVACATRGFTDLLELRRQERAALYDLSQQHPAPLVAPDQVFGVPERMAPEGVVEPLTDAGMHAVVHAVLDADPETIAVTLLHAYAHPAHEQQLAEALRAESARRGTAVDVITSHDVLPEIREYERMASTVAEAYARPAVRRYLDGLSSRLSARGYPAPRVMTSSGGTLTAAVAAQHAAALALSGPAGGVTGAAAVARALGVARALTIDIGGTSADVGLIEDGEPLVERGGNVAGVPIALPRVLVEAVAAGGGSIAWLDDGGALRAGPESAGAAPGPAAYARGGERATVTDAHVVLGTIAAGDWSGGVRIDRNRARAALAAIADPLGVSVERAATAVIATADATMARALRRVSVERGVDPRGIPLIAFGGGGPLHACGLAQLLGMRQVIVPPHAGVLSAVGLALAPERRESLTSCTRALSQWSDDEMRVLLHQAARVLAAGEMSLEARWSLRARYVGQGYELDIPVTLDDSVSQVTDRFVARHEQRTGFTLDREVECISARTTLSGVARTVRWHRTQRADTVHGAAVVPLPDATLLVAAGWTARPLDIGGWMLEADV
ncbi:MAG TPA: hydantoinase/oxoprolinase family protein [Gemmatimonas aurantiaca]|uniref:Hydantoin utilization protein A n=2 Tax=Gemmatimonas aurantiaca TaxID=173480 RepID=C1A7L1_GEMAT|nr:hydantoinase/oxoprolinase family protein [Gemmatimonas aurantiaca]BAH38221.1 hydantoin utilization protein A [Gemmatimonas aurantiaca T-27]HCT56995.1 hydantoinase/oxoprolinase family protein [Gemmatimonas aurantiaca]